MGSMTLEEAKKRIAELDSGSRFFGSDYESGWEDALCRATEILDEVDTEPVGKSDKMTLTELAQELRKIFKFRYLTVSEDWPLPTIIMWGGKVEYDGRGWNMIEPKSYYGSFNVSSLCTKLDLSEYADENGVIDYSRCIVEVSDASE